jgi:HAD superfamily hydrolase (TIGR01509 family)
VSTVPVAAVIFDFDGLLMDTESTMLASWQYEWRQHGLELEEAGFWADHGGDVSQERYRRLAEAVGPSYDQARSHARRLVHRDELHAALGLADGMAGWLDQAAAAGLRLAVASSSPVSWVRGHLERAGRLGDFELLCGGDEVGATKPAPDVYELALTRLGLPAGQAVAVEDTPHGVTAAQAAGLRCIAIPNPHTGRDRFGHADLVLGSAAEASLDAAIRRATSP